MSTKLSPLQLSHSSSTDTDNGVSYANAVLKLPSPKQQPQQTLHTEINKKSIVVVMKTTDEETPSSTAPQEPITSPPATAPTPTPAPDDNEDDDSNFVPVIGHKKGQARAKKRARDTKHKSGQSSSEHAAGGGTAASKEHHQGKGKSGKRRERKSGNKEGKEQEKQDGATVDSSGNSSDVNKSETENQPPKKFVEAPLPKVNAWKVSSYFFLSN